MGLQTAVSEQQTQLGQRVQSLRAVTFRASAVEAQLAEGIHGLSGLLIIPGHRAGFLCPSTLAIPACCPAVHAQISAVRESNRARAENLEAASKQVESARSPPDCCSVDTAATGLKQMLCLQLAAKRTELLVHVMPDAMRSNQLLLSMHSEELYVEQQKR